MPEIEPDPFAGRTLQSLAKSLTHHTNRLRARMGAAEKLGIHVRIWPDSPASIRLAELRDEMEDDWEECGKYATALMQRIASMLDGLDPRTMGLSSIEIGGKDGQATGKNPGA